MKPEFTPTVFLGPSAAAFGSPRITSVGSSEYPEMTATIFKSLSVPTMTGPPEKPALLIPSRIHM